MNTRFSPGRMTFAVAAKFVGLLGRGSASILAKVRTCIRYLLSTGTSRGLDQYASLDSAGDLTGDYLAFAEKKFTISRPVRLTVRVDRAYDNGNSLVLLELKTRTNHKIYPADIIELSAQRLAVRYSVQREVADYGYVMLVHPFLRKQSLHRVGLAPERTIVALARRWQQLLAGLVEPFWPQDPAKCKRCEYRAECEALAASPVANVLPVTPIDR